MGEHSADWPFGFDPLRLDPFGTSHTSERRPVGDGDDPNAPSTGHDVDFFVRDLQTLLNEAVQRLAEATASEAVFAWALRNDGEPYVAAAAFQAAAPLDPEAACFATLAALPSATDLTERRLDDEVLEVARRHQCNAVAPILSSDGHAVALLLLRASASDTARRQGYVDEVAPRTLALLDSTARRLAGPVATVLAFGRFRDLDRNVQHLDRLRSLGELTGELAHELRNPLVSVKTFLQLLPERKDDHEFLDQFCQIASEELRRMERLLDTVLSHADPRDLMSGDEHHSAEIARSFDAVAELLYYRGLKLGVEISVARDEPGLTVGLSEDRLRQVVLNLALNALDASPRGGTVRLSARELAEGVEVRVRDQGSGVADELRDTLFEPFVSTRRGGPGGLGLSISRRIVEEVGGEISVRDHPDGGAEFTVLLPSQR